MPEPTQNSATAGAATGTSTAANSNGAFGSNQQDPNQSQPANASVVDGGSAEGNRNSGSSDGGNGGNGDDGGRSRPGRAEREIKDLKARIKELERSQSGDADLAKQVMDTRVSPSQVQLPDYSQMETVTPAQIQQDIVKAAEQIVDVKMGALAKSLEQGSNRNRAVDRALAEIDKAKATYKALNHNDEEHYNQELDEKIGDSYLRMFKVDPSYTFEEHLDTFKPLLEAASTTAAQGTTQGGNRGTSANRSNASSRRSQKEVSDMTLDELEAHIHNLNGR